MFRKPYKVKTSTTVKGSERRRLRSLVESSYPALSAEDVDSLFPNKGEMNQVKALTHTEVVAMIYYAGKNPTFFQVYDKLYPTIYTLWKFPKLLPTVTTIPPVLEKIINGADLMAPGVVVNSATETEIVGLKPKDLCAVRIYGNKAPIAVGKALMSSESLHEDGVKGKAVSIVHAYQDTLWLSGDQQDPPILTETDVDDICEEIENANIDDSFETEPTNVTETSENASEAQNKIEDQDVSPNSDSEVIETISAPEYTMDDVLNMAFLTALKVSGKKLSLPVLTSTFYSSYVQKSCPPQLNLDIKKSTYKKVSVFLKKMQKEGILQIKELSKGVESIVSINLENEIVRSFRMDPMFKSHVTTEKEKCVEEDPSANVQENYKFPLVTELFVISAQVKSLFEAFKMRKGDTIPGTTVKDVLKRYVKENSLQNPDNPRQVTMDPILSDCALKKNDNRTVMTWEDLFDVIVDKMPPAYQIEYENKQPLVKKGKLEPITVTVETRSGNKKVTLINNLDTYGINPDKLAHHVQVAVAASTSINPTQNGKGTYVLIQGNQVRYLQKLFLEIFKVPRKYVQGLENVPKKK